MTAALVLDEASAAAHANEPASGNTAYSAWFPIPPALFHATDEAHLSSLTPDAYVHWDELDYLVCGQTGAVDRNAYVLGGITNYSDAHDFRGDHAIIPQRVSGAYGDVGSSGDYSTSYAQGVAAQGYPDVSREASWDSLSAGF